MNDQIDFNVPEGYILIDKHVYAEMDRAQQELKRVEGAITEQESRLKHGWAYAPHRQLEFIFQYMNREMDESYHNALRFRDQMLASLKAMEINIQSVLMASTHREKDARIRGLLDVVAVSADKLGELTEDWFNYRWWPRGIFRSESSLPYMQRQMWEYEQKIEAYQKQFGPLPAPDGDHQGTESDVEF